MRYVLLYNYAAAVDMLTFMKLFISNSCHIILRTTNREDNNHYLSSKRYELNSS